MSVFKLYLGRILGSYREEVDSVSGPLCYYQQHFRSLIGKVLIQPDNLGQPGPYIPLFYQLGLQGATKIFAEVRMRIMRACSHCCYLVGQSSYESPLNSMHAFYHACN